MENFAKKLGLNEKSVLSKAKEIERLLETKKSSTLNLDASLQCIYCLHVAANMKGKEFDIDLAIKLSGVGKKVYSMRLFTVEKLLDLQPLSTVQDLCLKLGLSELSKEANILKNRFDAQSDHEDHPMYSAGAIWVVAKSQKVSIEKAKIANLARTTWVKLESVIEKMKKLYEKEQVGSAKKGRPRKHVFQEIIDNINEKNGQEEADSEEDEIEEEDYESWRKRMIKEAHEEMEHDAKKLKLEKGKK